MAVGLVAEQAVRQPDHRLHRQMLAQHSFDLCAVQVRIAVGVEQAFLGGQQRALAVHVNGAAFQHEAGRDVAGATLDAQHLAGHLAVALPGPVQATVEAAPGVEVPVHAAHFAVAVDDEGRAGVAYPGVIAAHLHQADVRLPAQSCAGVLVLRGGHTDAHRLEARNGLGHGAERRLGRLATQAPVVRAFRPEHPGLAVRFPFRRHAKAVGARGLQRHVQDSRLPSRVFSAPYRFGRRSRNTPQALRIFSSASRSKRCTRMPSSVSFSSCSLAPN